MTHSACFDSDGDFINLHSICIMGFSAVSCGEGFACASLLYCDC